MTAPDEHQDDSPATRLRFRLGPRHAQKGIPILDDHTGQLVATIGASVVHSDLVASLFVTAPQLLYGIGRARRQLRALAQRKAHPDDAGTLAVRQLLRDLDEQLSAMSK